MDRHCEPTGRANARPMTGSAKQSSFRFAKPNPSSRGAAERRLEGDGPGRSSFEARKSSHLRMTDCDMSPRSRGAMRPRFCKNVRPSENQRAQGMPGAQCARSLVCKIKQAYEHSHHGHTGTTRHSPRNGFTAYFALSSVTTLFDTVACASYRRLDANDWGVGTTRLRRT